MLHLHRSHRLELLAQKLATLLQTPLRSPLQSEIVVVQSLGMRRWLSLQLAQKLGVTMNARFPFPADFAQQIFGAAFPGEAPAAIFSRDLLPWRVLALLPAILDAKDAGGLRHYLQGDNAPLKSWQLAHRIAGMFDRYLAYRPELLMEWQKKRRPTDWQEQLWQALTEGPEAKLHPPALLQRLQNAVAAGRTDLLARTMPERIAVFGLSSLPPLYVHLLQSTAHCLDVHLFVLEPSKEFLGELKSQREKDRAIERGELAPEADDFDIGNPLVSSLGRAGREFARMLVDLDAHEEPFLGEDSAPRDTLLHQLQADLFELRNPAQPEDGEPQPPPPLRIAADDSSIRVHCCHSPMREVEVLHDQLLDLFQGDSDLQPRDILVAIPDLETYAPFIEAVFGSPEHPRTEIPFTVADRTGRAESGVADAFLRLLDLHGGRFSAPAVVSLLDSPSIRARYRLRDRDLDVLRTWIAECGIRWGIDEQHRESLGLPAVRENSWRAGLDRLLLGYALPGDGRTLCEGILPFREIEGSLATTLGQFVEFAEHLFTKIPALSAARSLEQWQIAFRDLLQTFFSDTDEFADEVRRLREAFAGFEHIAQAAGFTDSISFEVIRAHLETVISSSESGVGFLNGAVTFCALKPMRAIPFRVICLLGMNDKAFPRHDPGLAFDRMIREPRRGDRSQRDEDRYLFLEALLSARDVLYLSYTGRSVRDDRQSPPSVVVTELLDYLDAHYTMGAGKLSDYLVIRQRLQPFSAEYFTGDGRLFSYSAENSRTAPSEAAAIEARPFLAQPMPPPDAEWFDVEVAQLARFFEQPTRFFCTRRLRMAEPEEFTRLEECEPTDLDSLTRYSLSKELTDCALAHHAPRSLQPSIEARGILPHGYAGAATFAKIAEESALLAARIGGIVTGDPLPPLSISATLGDWRLTGTLHHVYAAAQIRYRPTRLKAKDLLSAWVHHLALQLGDSGPRETLVFMHDGTWRFRPVENAVAVLHELLALYREGLQSPLPFFPVTSHEFASRTLQPKKTPPLDAARTKWLGSDFSPSEHSDDAWYRLCFPEPGQALDARWEQISLQIFTPLLHACEEVSL